MLSPFCSPGPVSQTSPANQSLQQTRQSDRRVLPIQLSHHCFLRLSCRQIACQLGEWALVSEGLLSTDGRSGWAWRARGHCLQTRWSGSLRLTAGVGSSTGWVGASGQTQSLASSCLSSPKLAAFCWQPLNHFTARAVSARSRASSGATDGGVCYAYIVACGEISPHLLAETPGLSWVFRSSVLLTFRFGIRL